MIPTKSMKENIPAKAPNLLKQIKIAVKEVLLIQGRGTKKIVYLRKIFNPAGETLFVVRVMVFYFYGIFCWKILYNHLNKYLFS